MHILCTFRPADPGVEVLVARLPPADDMPPPVIVGWLLTQITPATANFLFDCAAALKLGNSEIRNVAVKLPHDVPLEMHVDHTALSDLWTATRDMSAAPQQHRLALLPNCLKTLADLTGEPSWHDLRDQVDVSMDANGVWLQIYDPELSLSFISCQWPWALIGTLAGRSQEPLAGTVQEQQSDDSSDQE